MITQAEVNTEILKLLNNRTRKQAIKFQQICDVLSTVGATEKQADNGILELRLKGEAICSLPNIGFFIGSEEELDFCKKWVQHWRQSMQIEPDIPESINWM